MNNDRYRFAKIEKLWNGKNNLNFLTMNNKYNRNEKILPKKGGINRSEEKTGRGKKFFGNWTQKMAEIQNRKQKVMRPLSRR